jgi:hypothetical protein
MLFWLLIFFEVFNIYYRYHQYKYHYRNNQIKIRSPHLLLCFYWPLIGRSHPQRPSKRNEQALRSNFNLIFFTETYIKYICIMMQIIPSLYYFSRFSKETWIWIRMKRIHLSKCLNLVSTTKRRVTSKFVFFNFRFYVSVIKYPFVFRILNNTVTVFWLGTYEVYFTLKNQRLWISILKPFMSIQ